MCSKCGLCALLWTRSHRGCCITQEEETRTSRTRCQVYIYILYIYISIYITYIYIYIHIYIYIYILYYIYLSIYPSIHLSFYIDITQEETCRTRCTVNPGIYRASFTKLLSLLHYLLSQYNSTNTDANAPYACQAACAVGGA